MDRTGVRFTHVCSGCLPDVDNFVLRHVSYIRTVERFQERVIFLIQGEDLLR